MRKRAQRQQVGDRLWRIERCCRLGRDRDRFEGINECERENVAQGTAIGSHSMAAVSTAHTAVMAAVVRTMSVPA